MCHEADSQETARSRSQPRLRRSTRLNDAKDKMAVASGNAQHVASNRRTLGSV